jgi:hypothetical protein
MPILRLVHKTLAYYGKVLQSKSLMHSYLKTINTTSIKNKYPNKIISSRETLTKNFQIACQSKV